MINDTISITGKLKCVLTNPDGTIAESKYCNMVMTSGRVLIAQFLSNQKPAGITEMAVGTDATVCNVAQTALVSEVYRKQLNSSINDNNICIVDCVYGEGEAVGYLREAGLFNEDGVMVSRALITIDKGIYQQLTISWQITIA